MSVLARLVWKAFLQSNLEILEFKLPISLSPNIPRIWTNKFESEIIESKLAVAIAIVFFGSRGQQESGQFAVVQELTNIMNGF